jgi:hypothetical protein
LTRKHFKGLVDLFRTAQGPIEEIFHMMVNSPRASKQEEKLKNPCDLKSKLK